VRDKLGEESPFPAPLGLNVVPWVGDDTGSGWTSEETALRDEVRQILGTAGLPVAATCVQVPVAVGHSVAVHAGFERRIPLEDARQALVEAPSVVVLDGPEGAEFPTPVDVAGSDPAFVGRMRQGSDDPHSLDLFLCVDNLRHGAALNLVQVAELVASAPGA
jgi:aspartate-semialdehyde dehydrogenase